MSNTLSKFNIIGESPVMQELANLVKIAARHSDTILITGERGTGKELLAHAIHQLSRCRAADPVIVDCASLHASTAESVLFGHERGAFTGAVNRHIGLLETAHENTLFLDEISTLPLELQSRFLRFLEERTIRRIGAASSKPINTRVIAATNRDLEADTQNGLFLPDLFDRLNVLHLVCPTLRQREDDVLLLLRHFLGEVNFARLREDALETVCQYSFPGNVRELRHLCRRLEVFHPNGPITADTMNAYLNPVCHSIKIDGNYNISPINSV